jgi:23S rRNA (uracil1939-C5)-methyltransferase
LARRHRKNKPKQYQLTIESLSNEGRGIAHFEGKTIFVRGALIGEKVIAQRYLNRSKYDEADTVEVLTKASQRIEAKCEVFGICGGCSLQYLSSEDQVLEKQKWLKDHMQQQAKIAPKTWLEPILSNPWQYRRKARLGVRYVEKKRHSFSWF